MYSQNNEEEVILKFFGETFKGRFLDVGAYDGKTESNTRKLFELGWNGVLVEPSPAQFCELLKLYGKDNRAVLVNAAVSHTPSMERFHYCSYWASTLSEAQVKRHPDHDLSTVFWVNTVGIQSFIQWVPFNFISIDTEDRDWEICTCLTDSVLDGCRMISVEHSHHSDEDWKSLFSRFGFKFHHWTPENRIFIR